jgi:hypothetical protein
VTYVKSSGKPHEEKSEFSSARTQEQKAGNLLINWASQKVSTSWSMLISYNHNSLISTFLEDNYKSCDSLPIIP